MSPSTIQDLSEEILAKIFDYLTIVDLISAQNVNTKFREVVSSLSLSKENKRRLKVYRVKYRNKKEHLDVYDFATWFTCENEYRASRSLQSLCIKSENIDIFNLFYALVKLRDLKELMLHITSFSINVNSIFNYILHHDGERMNGLRRLSISLPKYSTYFIFLHSLLTRCSNLKSLHVHLIVYNQLSRNYDSELHKVFYSSLVKNKIYLKCLESLVMTQETLMTNSREYDDVSELGNSNFFFLKYLLKGTMRAKSLKCWIAPEIQEELATKMITMQNNVFNVGTGRTSSFRIGNNYQNEWTKHYIFEDSVGSLYLSVTSNDLNDVFERYLHSFNFGNVKYFCFSRIKTPKYISTDAESLAFKRFFPNLVQLNLANIHSALCIHLCKQISNLTELRSLSLSACLAVNSCCKNEENHSETSPLKIIAQKCFKLTELEIFGCVRCADYSFRENVIKFQWDVYLSALSEIRNLTTLSLSNIPFVTNVSFLKEVAERCKISRLRIHNLGVQAEHQHFMDCLSTFLQKASSLTHFRISERTLDLSDSFVWKSIGKAKNLQEIRILSATRCYLNAEEVSIMLLKLIHLSVLHIHAPAKRKWFIDLKQRLTMKLKGTRPYPSIVTMGSAWRENNVYLAPKKKFIDNCRECCLTTNVSQLRL